jgi:hypothetical protein
MDRQNNRGGNGKMEMGQWEGERRVGEKFIK